MKYLNTFLIVCILIVVGVIAYNNNDNTMGSVAPMGGYDYAQYTTGVATTTQIMVSPGIFGSVIINEDAAAAIVYYDSATTTTTGLASSTYSTKIAEFEAAATEGVYTFDTNVTKGLVQVTSPGNDFAGDITVTYRQGY